MIIPTRGFMDEPIFTLFDDQPINIPARSSFYHLEPVGIGTAEVESGTSLLSRYADAHRVRMDTFLKELGLKGETNNNDGVDSAWFRTYPQSINGFGKVATDYITLMEEKTQLKDLEYTTLLPIKSILNWQFLLRKELAWCPLCLEDWQCKENTIYYPLIWHLQKYQICLRHNIYIVNECPNCGHCMNILEKKVPPGFCQRCANWLGSTEIKKDENIEKNDEREQAWDRFCSKNIAELIEKANEITFSKEHLMNNFNWYLVYFFNGNYRDLSEHFDISTTTGWDWCHGNIPGLIEQLRFCYNAEITLTDLLSKDIHAETPGGLKRLAEKFKRKKATRITEIKKNELESDLKKALEYPPTSLAELAREIGVSKKTLYRHCPELTKEISSRYLEVRKKQAAFDRERECEKIRNIILALSIMDEKPTRARMERSLGRNPRVKDKWIHDEYKEIRRIYGYKV